MSETKNGGTVECTAGHIKTKEFERKVFHCFYLCHLCAVDSVLSSVLCFTVKQRTEESSKAVGEALIVA